MTNIRWVQKILHLHDVRLRVIENKNIEVKKELFDVRKELYSFKDKFLNFQNLIFKKIDNIELFLNKHFEDDIKLLNKIFWGSFIEFVILVIGVVFILFFLY